MQSCINNEKAINLVDMILLNTLFDFIFYSHL